MADSVIVEKTFSDLPNGWEDSVYRVQYSDPIVGGQYGIVNIQATQIANRTKWLNLMFAKSHYVAVDGTPLGSKGKHTLSATDFSQNAHIDASKATLDVPFATLEASLDSLTAKEALLQDTVDEVLGDDHKKFQALTAAMEIIWSNTARGFSWEFFNGQHLTSRATTTPIPVVRTVAGDDSVDVADSSMIITGNTYLLQDTTGTNSSVEVTVKNILATDRIIMYSPVAYSYNNCSQLTSTDWETVEGTRGALVKPGGIYISTKLYNASTSSRAKITINRKSSLGTLKVYYKLYDNSAWTEATSYTTEIYADSIDYTYTIEGGSIIYKVVNTSTETIHVNYMVLYSDVQVIDVKKIKTPEVILPLIATTQANVQVQCTAFRSAFNDYIAAAEFRFTKVHEYDATTDTLDVSTVDPPSWIEEEDTYIVYIPAETGVLDELSTNTVYSNIYTLGTESSPPDGDYYVRCRHISDIGDISEWSYPKHIKISEPESYLSMDNSDSTLDDSTTPFISLTHYSNNFGFYGSDASGFDEGLFTLTSN